MEVSFLPSSFTQHGARLGKAREVGECTELHGGRSGTGATADGRRVPVQEWEEERVAKRSESDGEQRQKERLQNGAREKGKRQHGRSGAQRGEQKGRRHTGDKKERMQRTEKRLKGQGDPVNV